MRMAMGYGFEACDEKVSSLTAHSGARARLGVRRGSVRVRRDSRTTSPASCAACCTWECSRLLKFSMKSTIPSARRIAKKNFSQPSGLEVSRPIEAVHTANSNSLGGL